MDPEEVAFLQNINSIGEADYAPSAENTQPAQAVDEDDEEDYDPSALMPDDSFPDDSEPASQPANSTHSPAVHDTLSRLPSEAIGKVTATPTQSRPSSALPDQQSAPHPDANKQPRTVGGFIVDDDEDEDVDNETPFPPFQRTSRAGTNGLLAVAQSTSTPQRSVSRTPNNITSSNVQNKNDTQDQGVSDFAPNGSSNAVSPATPIPNPNLSQQSNDQNTHNISAPVSYLLANASISSQKARLPNDRVGILEDRIAEDPRGDTSAWLTLIDEYRNREKFEEVRAVYDRFLRLFPSAGDQWDAYAQMELDRNEFGKAEQIFQRSLLSVPHVRLWSTYLTYIRRRHNLVTDPTGKARQTVTQAYDFVLNTVGVDKDSGQIWQDYIEFIRSGPGQAGGTAWQDLQKMDLLRKAYRRAVCVPTSATTKLWKEYDVFERSINKTTGAKFLLEMSPSYTDARIANHALSNITERLKRTTLPVLPPRPGFDGESEYLEQVEIWKQWINKEKEDPLTLKKDDVNAYRDRVIYVYKQAVMALRFWPEMWYDAAEFCVQNAREDQGSEFLEKGVAANPESCLLAFKEAEQRELTTGQDDQRRGIFVRQSYDRLHDALYQLYDKTKSRQDQAIARLQQPLTDGKDVSNAAQNQDEDDRDGSDQAEVNAREEARKVQIEAVNNGYEAELLDLQKLISSAWIGLMRAMRRIIGKGHPKDETPPGGLRKIFLQSRTRGKVLSVVYVASAQMEWHCYEDDAAMKLFDRGLRLFKTDEYFAAEYLKFLINKNDSTNARRIFETAVNQLTQNDHAQKAKPLFKLFHEYESDFGELGQIKKLEKRMAELFPEDPQLELFKDRFSTDRFDPTTFRVNISPATQSRPRPLVPIVNSIERGASPAAAPAPPPVVNSPKRPLPFDESDGEQPRKFLRGESPLKGAAGRRQQQQQKRNQQRLENMGEGSGRYQPAPAPLPQGVMGLLNILPAARHYKNYAFPPEHIIELLKIADMSRARLDRGPAQMMGAAHVPQSVQAPVSHQMSHPMPPHVPTQMPPQMPTPMGYGQPNYGYGYPR